MIKQMSFSSKLLFTYSWFIAILVFLLGLGFYYYNSYTYEKNYYSSLNNLSDKISQQLDNCIKIMDYLSIDVISNEDIISALMNMQFLDREDTKNFEIINQSNQVLRKNVLRYSIDKTVYRMSIFNTKGDFFTGKYYTANYERDLLKQKIRDLTWIEKAREKLGMKLLLPPEEDNWVINNPEEVFSLVRVIKDPSNEVGFVEIQNSMNVIKNICSMGENKELKVIVINDEDALIYTNKTVDKQELAYYASVIRENETDSFTVRDPVTNLVGLCSRVSSDYTGWTVLILQDRASLLKPLMLTRNVIFLVGLLITVLTLAFFYFFSKHLTAPLRKLKVAMEEMNIYNLPEQLVVKHENNEIVSLNNSFQQMRERLNNSMKLEIKSRSMHAKAHFDALQSQINPHFIYNMLNVLANMGDEAGICTISDTCRRIAGMLRYSTSTENEKTTLKCEIDHVENYLNLMKKRFEHKLEYRIEVDERLFEINIPKIILQPLVENSIYHGFTQRNSIMRIRISGVLTGDEWKLDIIDNGSGFSDEVLRDLQIRIERYAANIYSNDEAQKLSIGGMGIVSTFARLSLYYGKELKFSIMNNETKGACIRIGGSITTIEQGG